MKPINPHVIPLGDLLLGTQKKQKALKLLAVVKFWLAAKESAPTFRNGRLPNPYMQLIRKG